MLGRGGVPPSVEAVLQRRAVPGPIGPRATGPYRDGHPGVRPPVLELLRPRRQLVRGQGRRRPRGRPRLPRAAPLSDAAYRVTPMTLLLDTMRDPVRNVPWLVEPR